jgi:hypothetical protein
VRPSKARIPRRSRAPSSLIEFRHAFRICLSEGMLSYIPPSMSGKYCDATPPGGSQLRGTATAGKHSATAEHGWCSRFLAARLGRPGSAPLVAGVVLDGDGRRAALLLSGVLTDLSFLALLSLSAVRRLNAPMIVVGDAGTDKVATSKDNRS